MQDPSVSSDSALHAADVSWQGGQDATNRIQAQLKAGDE